MFIVNVFAVIIMNGWILSWSEHVPLPTVSERAEDASSSAPSSPCETEI